MSRFESFNKEELWHLRSGLLSELNYNIKNEVIRKMYDDITEIETKKERARIAALPHCSCCNQVITGKRND